MQGIIDADTHISEGEAMWAMMEKAMQPRRPIMLSVPEDTWYGNRNAFWLIDGEIYPKPAGKGSFALVTPSAQKVQAGRKDSTPATREMTDIKGRLADMDKLHTAKQIVYPTLFLVYNTKDRELEIALCRAYNRFLAQACAQSSGSDEMGRGFAVSVDERSSRRNPLRQREWRRRYFLSRHRRRLHARQSVSLSGLRGGAEAEPVDLRPHRLRRQGDSRNVRAISESHLRSHSRDAAAGLPRSHRQ